MRLSLPRPKRIDVDDGEDMHHCTKFRLFFLFVSTSPWVLSNNMQFIHEII